MYVDSESWIDFTRYSSCLTRINPQAQDGILFREIPRLVYRFQKHSVWLENEKQ